MNTIRLFIRDWLLPPRLVDLLTMNQKQVSWEGTFKTWKDAKVYATGYESPNILKKVLDSTRKVVTGQAAYERDSVAFVLPDYNWPFATMLFWIFSKEKKKVTVVDFGGSLGSLYFQHRALFTSLPLKWHVVEQSHFVEAANKYLNERSLAFFKKIEDSERVSKGDVLLLSGVVQYLENPHSFISGVLESNYKYILIERTAFFDHPSTPDRLTIQIVKEPIYEARYPAWFFSEQKFLKHFEKKYQICFSFRDEGGSMRGTTYKGMLLKLKQ